ncbi:MAG: acetyl-CoA carboxylase biotin carboxyl carrier protein [Firmicutes bacterium]|nr:acetyl-CoA carboxylase biotin carboxyl carrier protein [Bacillota bacterium]MDY2818923.1 acetyl-CoA carboxylase biotin carboxyl carrier protein [Hominisplanchenecus sp.]
MELENILKLIDKVSASGLTEFTLEEGNLQLSMKKEEMPVKNVTTSVEVKGAENVPTPVMEEEGNQVTSPLVGTFYLAPSPDAAPFVNIGDTVKKGQTLGIIEAMKLMNEIECEYDGVVADVLVKNGEMVEYGQPLFVIR